MTNVLMPIDHSGLAWAVPMPALPRHVQMSHLLQRLTCSVRPEHPGGPPLTIQKPLAITKPLKVPHKKSAAPLSGKQGSAGLVADAFSCQVSWLFHRSNFKTPNLVASWR